MRTIVKLSLIAACALAPAIALADSTVNATDDIYAVGSQSGVITNCVAYDFCPPGGLGTVPNGIAVGSATYFTFSTTGTITLDDYDHTNDPDGLSGGLPAYGVTASNPGFDGISGITAPGAGFLVGVFLAPGGPGSTAPASLTYTAADEGDPSYSPLLDQVFFIGDGLTGDGTGSTQTFYVPTGATELYLGINDSCFFVGVPSCYDGNYGAYNAVVTAVTPTGNGPSPTPEPSSLVLLGSGLLGAAGVLRRKLTRK